MTNPIPSVIASAHYEPSGAGGALRVAGRLDSAGITATWPALCVAMSSARRGSLTIDASDVTYCDGSGIGILAGLVGAWRSAGGTASIAGLQSDLARLVEVAADAKVPEAPRSVGFVASCGESAIATTKTLVDLVNFIGRVLVILVEALVRPRSIRWSDTLRTFLKAGVLALPVVSLLCFLIGAIIAFQTIGPMSQYGAKLQVAQVVGVAVIRELGPLITAIVLAGRSGSAFAAEIGTMRVTQEIDALSTFGLDPVRFLVVPRMLAAMFAMPLLSTFGDLMGVAGGFSVLMANGFTLGQYVDQLQISLTPSDFLQGLAKSVVFAILVGGTGCYCGLRTKEGPGAVGDSTTRSVVAGIVLIIAADAVLGAVFHVVGI
ncbi:MAG: ABC transporter permease [Phycisphaerae bacterium]|nr:ABC transporter permease [Phycisphaerae bacterium]